MSGWAHYRLSLDKKTLAIIDIQAPASSDEQTYSDKDNVASKNMSWIESLGCDFGWSVKCVFAQIVGAQQPDILEGDNGIVLHKTD